MDVKIVVLLIVCCTVTLGLSSSAAAAFWYYNTNNNAVADVDETNGSSSTDPCIGQSAAPVSTACLNSIWKKSGCTTTIPDSYNGWWKQQPIDVIKTDMAAWGSLSNDPNDNHHQSCKVAFIN